MQTSTLKHYNKIAGRYCGTTVNVDFSKFHKRFLKYIPKGGCILDFGCGSGRDAYAFIKRGFVVDALDGSSELCSLAERLIAQTVICQLFQEFSEKDKYDGIWACSSILHLNKRELGDTLRNLHDALKSIGYLYASFKYGNFEGIRNSRYYTDLTHAQLIKLVREVKCFQVEEFWISSDTRKDRREEKWLNVILKKVTH